METCVCGKCLNPHCLYQALRKEVSNELPYSLSKFLVQDFKCVVNNTIHYSHIDCINGKCRNNCQIVDIAGKLGLRRKHNQNALLSYYVFERIETSYYDKNGLLKSYKRTARVDKKELFDIVVSKLQALLKGYLQHRFVVANDRYYWKSFLNNTEHPVLWFDYLQNINFVEKNQVQSAHYSGKQHTLHDTVMINPNDGGSKYIYHLSDDTNHDSVLTFEILESIIESHPELLKNFFAYVQIIVETSTNVGTFLKK